MGEYDKLSDRELDALVAERLLAEWVAEQEVGKFVPPNSIVIHIGGRSYWHPVKSEHMKTWSGMWELPRYASDIAAAMEVVEKMREQEFFPRLWAAQLWNAEFWYDEAFAGGDSGDSLPRAICIAALQASSTQPTGGS